MRDREHTKNLIITRAISLFNTQGYRATSLSDITKASGVTKGAIYGNFQNKDAVAVASFDYAAEKVLSNLRSAIKEAPTAPQKLKAITAFYSHYLYNTPFEGGCPIINTAIEADDNYPNLRMRVIRTIAIIKDSIKKIVTRGILEGQLKSELNIEEFALSFYATIKGAILISRVEGDTETYTIIRRRLEQEIDQITLI